MEFTPEELFVIEVLKARTRQWRFEDMLERERKFYAVRGQKKGRPRGTTSNVSKVSGRNTVS
jgi:hypothetical protein